MTHRRTTAFVLSLILIAACQSRHTGDTHVASASAFTRLYSKSRLSAWRVRASAAGSDCSILFVRTAVVMDDTMIESLHYGAGAYDVWSGGVQQFSRERGFRGVAYRDSMGRLWTFGSITPPEAETIDLCD